MIKLVKKWIRGYFNFCYIMSKNALAAFDLMDSIDDMNKNFKDKLIDKPIKKK
jgi:hypothetical protein